MMFGMRSAFNVSNYIFNQRSPACTVWKRNLHRVSKTLYDRPQVVGSQADIAVTDDDHLMSRLRNPSQEVIDLAVGAGPSVFNRNRDPTGTELLLDFEHQRDGRIIGSLGRQDDLVLRVILPARTAQVFLQVFLQPVNRLEHRHCGQFLSLCSGRSRTAPAETQNGSQTEQVERGSTQHGDEKNQPRAPSSVCKDGITDPF